MLQSRFLENIKERRLFQRSDKLLLAVSGGVDSVVLCDLCNNAGFSYEMAHANFQLRNDESDGDEIFVRKLAEQYEVTVHVKKFDTGEYAGKNKMSIQVAARELRYAWFKELLVGRAEYLLTAHHSGDNIETVLMNFFRGTGISGMRGILSKKEWIIRPLLPFSREEILTYAKEHQLQWREDSSNESDKYSRNYFRNTFLPLVSRIFPEAEANLTGNIGRFSDVELLYQQAIDHHKKKLFEQKGNEIHIPVLKLKKLQPLRTILFEIIKTYHFTALQVDEVMHLLDASHGKMVRSADHVIFRNRNWLVIAPLKAQVSDHVIISEGDNRIVFSEGVIEIKNIFSPVRINNSAGVGQIDLHKINYPLMLRRWKQGDYFYPLGLGKKKKISRFLIDQKLSKSEKEKVWILESDNRIFWVVGMRIDDRFKVTENTKKALCLKITFQF